MSRKSNPVPIDTLPNRAVQFNDQGLRIPGSMKLGSPILHDLSNEDYITVDPDTFATVTQLGTYANYLALRTGKTVLLELLSDRDDRSKVTTITVPAKGPALIDGEPVSPIAPSRRDKWSIIRSFNRNIHSRPLSKHQKIEIGTKALALAAAYETQTGKSAGKSGHHYHFGVSEFDIRKS